MNFCPKCGNKVEPNTRFCDACGESLEELSQETPPKQEQETPVQQEDKNPEPKKVEKKKQSKKKSNKSKGKKKSHSHKMIGIYAVLIATLMAIFYFMFSPYMIRCYGPQIQIDEGILSTSQFCITNRQGKKIKGYMFDPVPYYFTATVDKKDGKTIVDDWEFKKPDLYSNNNPIPVNQDFSNLIANYQFLYDYDDLAIDSMNNQTYDDHLKTLSHFSKVEVEKKDDMYICRQYEDGDNTNTTIVKKQDSDKVFNAAKASFNKIMNELKDVA